LISEWRDTEENVDMSDTIDRLLNEAEQIEHEAELIQASCNASASSDDIRLLQEEYHEWYAACLSYLPETLRNKFEKEYSGGRISYKIKAFLAEPCKENPMYSLIDKTNPFMKDESCWRYPFDKCFQQPIHEQMALLRQARYILPTASKDARPDTNTVFVIHGRDERARNTIYSILRAVHLKPLEFAQARSLTGRPSPYIGEILDAGLAAAQAIVILFTPDEDVRLRDDLAGDGGPDDGQQPRPNVIFEAGMAMGRAADRTVIVEMGAVRQMSDLAGRHAIRWKAGTPAERNDLLTRLQEIGCEVDRTGSDWMTV
jgi:predicted nucleotide-binding protein